MNAASLTNDQHRRGTADNGITDNSWSATWAMLWELWRISRFPLIGRLAFATLIATFLGSQAARVDVPSGMVISGLAMMMMISMSVFSPTWVTSFDSKEVGFSFRLAYLRPISTRRLVLTPMLFVIAVAIVGYATGAFVFWAVSGIKLAIWGPSLIIASVSAAVLATIWSPTTKSTRVIAIAGLLAGVTVAMFLHHSLRTDPEPALLVIGKPDYFSFAWHEYLVLLLTFSFSIFVTLVSVDRQRHGVRWSVSNLWNGSSAKSSDFTENRQSLATPKRAFRGPVEAQIWFEAKNFAPVMIASLLAALFVSAFTTLLPLIANSSQTSPVIWICALMGTPILFQFVGVDSVSGFRSVQGKTEYSTFHAATPMRSDHIVAIKILVIAAGSLFGFLVMACFAPLHAYFAGQQEAWTEISALISREIGNVPAWWWIVAAANGLFLFVCSSSALLAFTFGAALHRWKTMGLIFVAVIHGIIAQWDAGHGWRLAPLWTFYAYTIPLVIFLLSLFMIFKSLVTNTLGKRFFANALVLWIVYVCTTVMLLRQVELPIEIPFWANLWIAAAMLIPLASIAIAPLALARFRHG